MLLDITGSNNFFYLYSDVDTRIGRICAAFVRGALRY